MAYVYKLKTPVEVSGNKIETVTLEEPTFGMIAEIGIPADAKDPQVGLSMLREYVSRCTGLPLDTINQLKIRDALALIEKVGGFFISTE